MRQGQRAAGHRPGQGGGQRHEPEPAPPPHPVHDHAAEQALFGPSSVSWRLHADALIGLAAMRALLLQALHPRSVAGFSCHTARHPGLHTDLWSRLGWATDFLGVTTYGTAGEALTAGARLRAVLASLHGVDRLSGHRFAMDDAELLVWAHCCQVESTISVLDGAGVELDEADADRYVQEQLRLAALVGLDPAEVPGDLADLRAYFREVRPDLQATPEAREEARALVAPLLATDDDLSARPAWAPVAGLAFAALPTWARRMYALHDLPGAADLHGAATAFALHNVRASLLGAHGVSAPLDRGRRLPSARDRLSAAPQA